MTDHFVSVAQMIDDLRSDDRELRLVAMKALLTISQTLGPERTREELLPYITDYLDDDDAVLRAMASKLGCMLNEVGGMGHLQALLYPLEMLCSLDEVTVRDEAIAALNALAKQVYSSGNAEQQGWLMALITRLAQSEHPHSRSSACGLVGTPYALAGSATKRDLKALFSKLCEDSEVMVRRSACVALGTTVAQALEGAAAEFLGSMSKFCKDANDSVRLQTVQAAVAISPVLSDTGIAQVIGLMKTLSTDAAWRVRFMLADRLGALCAAWPAQDAGKVGLAMFRSLCDDSAPEVRASAVYNLDKLVAVITNDDAKRDAVKKAIALVTDSEVHVRSCLATVLLKALPTLPAELVTGSVVPCCQKLLEDDDPTVKLGLVGSFATAHNQSKSAGLKTVATAVIPVIAALFEDKSWRVREQVVEQLPAIVECSGGSSTQLLGLCTQALCDRVASIRNSGANACRQLAAQQDAAWTAKELIPKVTALAASPNYMRRVTLLHVIKMMLDVVDQRTASAELLPVLVRLSADPIANVRLNVAIAIRVGLAAKRLMPQEVETISAKLRADADVDVRDAMSPPAKP